MDGFLFFYPTFQVKFMLIQIKVLIGLFFRDEQKLLITIGEKILNIYGFPKFISGSIICKISHDNIVFIKKNI
jgi:hypothetical protein